VGEGGIGVEGGEEVVGGGWVGGRDEVGRGTVSVGLSGRG